MRKLLFLIFILQTSFAHAQVVIIKKIELGGDKITVIYDLDDSNPNNEYLLSLYTSKDNFNTPMSKVKGDVGGEIKPGNNKRIEWNIREEYGSYRGELQVEVRGKVFIPFVKIQSFGHGKSFKRGKPYELAWRPGNTNPVHIEVFKGSQRVGGELNLPNNGKHTINLASNLKPGSYKLKVTDSRKSDDFVMTQEFKVKRKFPLFFKIVPVLGAGYFLTTMLGGGGEEEIPGPPELPPAN